MVDYFKAEKVNEKITMIRSLSGEIMYLIEGTKVAALIDTSVGIKGFKEYVETLTDKEIFVILTHGHLDHAMGAAEFQNVYMSEKDTEVYKGMSDVEGRKDYIKMVLNDQYSEIEDEAFVAAEHAKFKDLKDGDVFDLGELHLDIYGVPGHTPGTMAVLLREERTIILGDACNNSTFLFDENSLSVEEYKESLYELKKKTDGKYDQVFACHAKRNLDINIISNVIGICDRIMAGDVDDMPYHFMGYNVFAALEMTETMERADGGEGNIIYNKNKIMKA